MDPYSESLRVVWEDPIDYDPLKYGPPYMPGMLELSVDQRSEVRQYVKQASFYDTSEPQLPEVANPLVYLLGVLQGASLLHQTHHWNTKGPSYYADHLLFERLYNESQEFIDGIAERALGTDNASYIHPYFQTVGMCKFIQLVQGTKVPSDCDSMVQSSLKAEVLCLRVVSSTIESLEAAGKLSPGVSNLLEGVADKHETFVYLLKQRSADYSYDYR